MRYRRLKPFVWTWRSELWWRFRTDGLVTLVLLVVTYGAYGLAKWLDQVSVAVMWGGAALVPLVLLAAVAARDLFTYDQRRRIDYSGAYFLLAVVICVAALVGVAGMLLKLGFQAILPFTIRVLAGLRSMQPSAWMATAAGMLTLCLGSVFFIFRLRQRFLYGITEAAAGAAVAAHRVTLQPVLGFPSDSDFYLALLTAGVYLVVRGLDNMHQAAKNDDPAFRWIIRSVSRRPAGAARET